MQNGIHYAGLIRAAQLIRDREISSVELTRHILDRVERLDPQLGAYSCVRVDAALREAALADDEVLAGRPLRPLHGVPVAVKDLFDVAGLTTVAGMPIRSDAVAQRDSTVVERLRAAGAVLIGKLQMTEGGYFAHHPSIRPPVNPWRGDLWPGASSSGSGVATAAGLTFGSLATDTGGSIRFPAAANGLTGLKPTRGRVSRSGVFGAADSLDHVGTLTRDVADAAVMLGVISGADPRDPSSARDAVPDYSADIGRSVQRLRVGVDSAYVSHGTDRTVAAMVDRAVRVFGDLGATTREVTMPADEAVREAWATVCIAGTGLTHANTYPARADEYGPLGGFLALAQTISPDDLRRSRRTRTDYIACLDALFTDVDVMLVPTTPVANITVAQMNEVLADPARLGDFVRFATPFDMSGHPTLALPGGLTGTGQPVGFQLVGRHFDEAVVLRAGHAYQQVTDWHLRHPATGV